MGEADARGAHRAGEASGASTEKTAPEAIAKAKCVIYALHDAKGAIFYVGRSTQPRERLNAHKQRFGHEITMEIVQKRFVKKTPADAESYWIRHYSARGCSLVNVNEGGSAWIKMRISGEDKALFTERAEEKGLSLSSWVRSCLRDIRKGIR